MYGNINGDIALSFLTRSVSFQSLHYTHNFEIVKRIQVLHKYYLSLARNYIPIVLPTIRLRECEKSSK